jgi:hypothetical protein
VRPRSTKAFATGSRSPMLPVSRSNITITGWSGLP